MDTFDIYVDVLSHFKFSNIWLHPHPAAINYSLITWVN